MAYIHFEHCQTCGKETQHCNGKCSACERREAEFQYKMHFGKLDQLTLEQRVRLIEEALYRMQSEPRNILDY